MSSSANNGHDDLDTRPTKRARTTSTRGVTGVAGWDEFKDDIYELYAVQNCSLEHLMTTMAARGLKASRRTYMKRITEWGFNKKIRRAEKDAMLRIERRRSAVGKKTHFRIRGQEVSLAKLRRAAAIAEQDAEAEDVDEVVRPDDRDDREDTLSCISYETLKSNSPEVEADTGGEIPPVHTNSWNETPGEQIWKMRSASRGAVDMPVANHPARPATWMHSLFLPFSFERDVVASTPLEINAQNNALFVPHVPTIEEAPSSADEEEEDDDTALMPPPPPKTCQPKPFKLRKFLTGTMPSLNYELRRSAASRRIDGVAPKNLITGAPLDDQDIFTLPPEAALKKSDDAVAVANKGQHDNLEHHLKLFHTAVTFETSDQDRNQHFSDILGILKSQYDREGATQSLMAMLFEGGALATEDQAFDKVEALLEQSRRNQEFERQTTLDACLAGIIFLLDATRLDADQQTWVQPTVRTRLERVRSLMLRIFNAHLHDETAIELVGDEEGKEIDPRGTSPDEEGMRKAARMMTDVVEAARTNKTVLHALELLPRYHRQWTGWHIQDNLSGRRVFFTM